MKIKLLSLNVWVGGKLFDKIIEFLRGENAEVVLLQEIYDSGNQDNEKRFRSLEEFKRLLNYPFFYYAPDFLDIKDCGKVIRGNLILSKYPIRDIKVVFYDLPFALIEEDKMDDYSLVPRNLQRVDILIGQGLVRVFNTQGIWGFDGEDNSRRLAMGKIIAKEIADKEKVILAGDFNVKEGTETIGLIEENLINIFKGEMKTSFNMRVKSKEGGFHNSVVDMVFVSKEIKVLEKRCLDIDISDHLPLIAVLEV